MNEALKNGYIRALLKRVIWHAQGGKCHLCGNKLPNKFHSPKLTFDHVWPVSKTGAHNSFEGNILLAHEACNLAKGDRAPKPSELMVLAEVNRKLNFQECETAVWERP